MSAFDVIRQAARTADDSFLSPWKGKWSDEDLEVLLALKANKKARPAYKAIATMLQKTELGRWRCFSDARRKSGLLVREQS